MPTYAIGIDFGGTKLLASVVDIEKGTVVTESKKRTRSSDGPDELIARISEAIDGALKGVKFGNGKKTKLQGIGIGIAGQVDAEKGMLLGAPNLSQATVNLPMAKLLTERFDVPVRLRNDVQIAAIGEATFGAGKGSANFLCVFVGTGVGGAIVRDGKLVTGATGTAGEIGHLVIDANGRICGCGGRGHLEAYASRSAMTRVLLAELERGRPSKLRELLKDGDTSIRSK